MLVRILVLALLSATLVPLANSTAQEAQAQQLRFIVQAPKSVELDEPFEFQLSVQGVKNFAAYEAVMLYDTEAAFFHAQEQRNGDLRSVGRAIAPLAAIEQTYGIALGAYSCAADSCLKDHYGKATPGGNGRIRLGSVHLVGTQPGVLQVTFAAIKLVDANGVEITPAIPPQTVEIQIGDPRESTTRHATPPIPWTLKPDVGTAGNFDVVPDRRISYADAAEVAIGWIDVRETRQPCRVFWDAAIDVNKDGCLDIADVQLVAANYGQTVEEQSAPDEGRDAPDSEAVDGPVLAQAGSTFVVNSTGDQDDNNIGNGVCRTSVGTCTLRAAIREANTDSGPNTIAFNIPGGGVQRIQLGRQLPALGDQSGGTTIDGYTQPGASPNTAQLASNAGLRIELRGGGEDQYVAFKITSSNNTIRGLSIFRFRKAIWMYNDGASNNTIVGNFIGTDAAGVYVSPVIRGAGHGIHLELGASGNRIGRPNLADRNVISGNGRHGVGIWHSPSNSNIIQNNIVGLSPDGSGKRPNRAHGLDINYGSSNNVLGGAGQFERNVISGNDNTGVEISHQAATSGNQVIDNFIGTTLNGNDAPSYTGNQGRGIMLEDGVRNNIIDGNVIVGSGTAAGIEVRHDYTTGNIIRNNRIGVTLDGTPAPNPGGIDVHGSNTMVGPNNIIAHNQWAGITVGGNDGDFNTITRNSIHSNGGLGINIAPGGVNQNDPGDGDSGPNQGQNFPDLVTATTTQVTGTACGGCTVEIFISDGGPFAYGEGPTFLASGTAQGDGDFTIAISGVSPGTRLTSTATNDSGNTSEFSQNIAVQ